MSGVSDADKQPTLKVMRLYKPKLHMSHKVLDDVSPTKGPDLFSLSRGMILPDSFGNIYLGETFCSYISVLNHFPYDLANVGLSAKLQTPSVRTDLLDVRLSRTGEDTLPQNPVPNFRAGSNLDMVVEHVLAELGVHTLRVGVTYSDSETGEPKTLRKYYRFNVMNPLTISFKHTAVMGDSYVEAHIKNNTTTALFFDSIVFQPTPPFFVEDLQSTEEDRNSRKSYSKLLYVNPEEKIQKVYLIKAGEGPEPTNQTLTNLGRLDIQWRTALGEAGRLQTQPVARKVPLKNQVEVTLENLPDRLILGATYVATCTVTNNSPRSLYLQLQFRKELMGGVFVSGVSAQNLGEVPSQMSKSTEVKLIPLVAGLHEVKGMVVVDLATSKDYPQEKLQDVIVEETAQ